MISVGKVAVCSDWQFPALLALKEPLDIVSGGAR